MLAIKLLAVAVTVNNTRMWCIHGYIFFVSAIFLFLKDNHFPFMFRRVCLLPVIRMHGRYISRYNTKMGMRGYATSSIQLPSPEGLLCSPINHTKIDPIFFSNSGFKKVCNTYIYQILPTCSYRRTTQLLYLASYMHITG